MLEHIKNKIAMKRMKIEPITDEAVRKALSQYTCNQCHNHCPLSEIRCGGGLTTRETALTNYKTANKQV